MQTIIALLRGINVGGNNIVPMKELRELMESNGYKNVRTYIQSGNVVYETDGSPSKTIGELIEQKYGFEPVVFILSADQLESAVAACPFDTDIGKTLHYFFCDGDLSKIDFQLLESLKAETEQFALRGNVFYLYAPDGIGRSTLVSKMNKSFKDVTTTGRNLNTINKLLSMIAE